MSLSCSKELSKKGISYYKRFLKKPLHIEKQYAMRYNEYLSTKVLIFEMTEKNKQVGAEISSLKMLLKYLLLNFLNDS